MRDKGRRERVRERERARASALITAGGGRNGFFKYMLYYYTQKKVFSFAAIIKICNYRTLALMGPFKIIEYRLNYYLA